MHNEAPFIQGLLESLLIAEQRLHLKEILIVDNASKDKSVDLAEQVLSRQEGIDWQIIRRSENNLGAARAQLIDLASAEWLAMIDADALATPHWLSRWSLALEKFATPEVAALGGPNHPSDILRRQQGLSESPFHRALQLSAQNFLGHLNSPQVKVFASGTQLPQLSTCNILLRREHVKKVGNFSSQFARIAEDLDLSHRLTDHGFTLVYDAENPIFHAIVENLGEWSKRAYRFGQAQWNVIALHPKHLSPRLLLPVLFLGLGGGAFWLAPALTGFLCFSYCAALIALSLYLSRKAQCPALWPSLTAVFIATHFSYAIGETVGLGRYLLQRIFFKRR